MSSIIFNLSYYNYSHCSSSLGHENNVPDIARVRYFDIIRTKAMYTNAIEILKLMISYCVSW